MLTSNATIIPQAAVVSLHSVIYPETSAAINKPMPSNKKNPPIPFALVA